MLVPDIRFTSAQHVLEEVEGMNVKGGSPFGRAAAWMFKLCCEQEEFANMAALRARFDELSGRIKDFKPTMATIANTISLVYDKLDDLGKDADVAAAKRAVIGLCEAIVAYSEDAVARLGVYGGNLISDGDVVMMHSYSSALMSVFQQAAGQGKKFRVICTESRPLRESRLAAKVLQGLGVPVTYITDIEIWEFMPLADFIIMGADSLTWDGRVANKIGTALVAQLAQACKKPVYIASEVYKLDVRTRDGYNVVLERRTKDEIISEGDFESLEGIEIINQFFDLTPAWQVTGLVTEFGVIAPATVGAYWEKLEAQLQEG